MAIENKSFQHVLALAAYRNFARAAESLHLTQPALSRSIAVLEGHLGVQLFDRMPSGVEPTAFGRIFIARCEEIALKENELVREIALMQGVEIGELSISAGPFPFDISVGPAVSRLLSNFPKLRVKLKEVAPHAIISRVLKGECDVGVADIRDLHDEPQLFLEALPLHVGVYCCRPEHPLVGRGALTQDNVLAYPWVGTTFPPQLSGAFESFKVAGTVDRLTRHFTCAVNIDSLHRARQTAIDCDVVFPVAIVAIGAQLKAGELVVLDCHPNWLHTNY